MPTSAERPAPERGPSPEGFPQADPGLEREAIRQERARLGLDERHLPLAGRRILLTRSPDRAGGMSHALKVHGASPVLLPLIDFERAEDQEALLAGLERLEAGEYDWLVISSITTIRAISEAVFTRIPEKDHRGMERLAAAGVKVATIGPTCRELLERSGWTVDLAPEDQQSAAGLLRIWSGSGQRILLPQADIAGPALAEGLRAAGNTVDVVTAYRTVDYPADPARRLTARLNRSVSGEPAASAFALLSPDQARSADASGGLDVVVAASPSAARAVVDRLGTSLRARFVAIGPSTAAEAERLGIHVAAIAAAPTPQGIVDAAIAALTD